MEVSTRRYKFFKDPVYGHVVLPEDIVKTIVDNPMFQRLRDVRQNGLAHYVYPHLEHSRFSHSLGVAQAMQEALKYIVVNTSRYVLSSPIPDEVRKGVECVLCMLENEYLHRHVLALALLHDDTHMPYSHLYEQALEDYISSIAQEQSATSMMRYRRHDETSLFLTILELLASRDGGSYIDKQFVQALISYVYAPQENIREVFKKCRQLFRRIAEGCQERCGDTSTADYGIATVLRLIRDLVNSNIDVDRADYMMRDSIASGVRYGLFDIERLFSVLVLVPPRTREDALTRPVLGVLDKGVSVVESMLISRSYMYSEVYLHRVVLSFNAMLARLLSLLINLAVKCTHDERIASPCKLIKLLNPDVAVSSLSSWIRFTDSHINVVVNICREALEGDEQNEVLAIYRELLSREDNDKRIRIVEYCASTLFLSYLTVHRKLPIMCMRTEGEDRAYRNVVDNFYHDIVQTMRRHPLVIVTTIPPIYRREREGVSVYNKELDVPILVRTGGGYLMRWLLDVGYLMNRIAEARFYRVVVLLPLININRIEELRRRGVMFKHADSISVQKLRELLESAIKTCLSLDKQSTDHDVVVKKIVSELTEAGYHVLTHVFR